MHILVLHQHYWPEIAATAQILSDVCEDLAAAGHRVMVVCGQPSYRAAVGPTRLPVREIHRGVEIRRVWSYTPKKRGIPQRLVHYSSYFATSFAAALQAGRPDVCLVMSTPPLLLGVSGTLLQALRGVPFVYSVQDLYPDIAVHLGVVRADGLVARSVGTIADHCYAAAASLVTLSVGMSKRLTARGVDPHRVHIIPNWADTTTLTPVARDNPFARAHGLDGHFVVQYSGNLGQSQGLEHLLDAAAELRDLPITILLVGDGNARASLETLAQQRSLDRVRFLPPQPREALSELLGACDVGLVPLKRGLGDDLVPSKLYGIMAAGRPVLASVEDDSEVARVLRDHECGLVVAPESGSALAQGIRDMYLMSKQERTLLGERGREACSQHYTRGALTRRYEHVLTAAAARTGEPASRQVRVLTVAGPGGCGSA